MNEDYTSKLRSKRHEVLEPMLDKQRKPIYAVRHCLTTSCAHLLGNPDVSACRIITYVFIPENSHQ